MSQTVPTTQADPVSLSAAIKAEAERVGFDLVGIAPAVTPIGLSAFQTWLDRGFAGEMTYLNRRAEAYAHPESVLSTVRSVIVLAINYKTEEPSAGGARVSRYAWGAVDYHDLLREKMRRLADFLHQRRPGCRTRGVVDTAPLLERDFARRAGLGWFGKNTMLINKRIGSWLFLAALLTDLQLEPDDPHEASHCGTCRACLDVCPTDAFPEPYVLDARKCISYLTIELAGPIPAELRAPMGEWLFGCDLCQEVCPWNNKAPVSPEPGFRPAEQLSPAAAIELLELSEEGFLTRFRGSPLLRPKRSGLLRNAAVVLGNAGDRSAVPALCRAVGDTDPVIRGAAAWALGMLGDESAVAALQSRLAVEDNADVLDELRAALKAAGQQPVRE